MNPIFFEFFSKATSEGTRLFIRVNVLFKSAQNESPSARTLKLLHVRAGTRVPHYKPFSSEQRWPVTVSTEQVYLRVWLTVVTALIYRE